MIPPIEDALNDIETRYAFLGTEALISAFELKLMAMKEQAAADAESDD